MILQALVEYYKRKSMDPESNLAPSGFEYKEIPFIILLNYEGKFVGIEDTREKVGKKLKGKTFKVPQSVDRANNILPNFLWDNPSYVLGISNNNKEKNADRIPKKHQSFLLNLNELYPHLATNPEIKSVIKFLESNFIPDLEKDALWPTIIEEMPNMTFRIAGNSHLVCQNNEVEEAISKQFGNGEGEQGICLISGETDQIARLHPPIKGVYGAQSMGTKIISINFDAAESYKKVQGSNSPIGVKACFEYTTALNYLLKSPQKLGYGEGTTIVFWAAKDNPFEDLLADLLDSSPTDDPDRQTKAVESLYKSPANGALAVSSDDTIFHILGLTPNAARLSIRFWWTTTVKELAGNIKQHFEDIALGEQRNKHNCFSLYRLLQGCALKGEISKLPPNLLGNLLSSIFTQDVYPYSLLSLTLRRTRDKDGISNPRAALIKGWVNRFTRKIQKNEKELHVTLDETNINPGYCLGRLFAVLEKIQEEAHGKDLNSTIRDRFYSAASTVPVTVFSNLMKLKNHHLKKLDNRGRAINFEKMIGEIMHSVHEFPSILSLADQGRFAIGYYHQKQNFYTKTQE
jgi:CRISPR-associated protein Csd1